MPAGTRHAPELTDYDKERYTRQIMIPGWGEKTQKKLKASKVFIAGAGGLGSPVSFNLAVAGVGSIRICDFDVPDLSNLNRQFLHDDTRLGINKAESARMTLSNLNPKITITAISEKIDENNVDALVGDSDLIMDCMDNFPTRFVLNACAVRKRIPMIHGSIWGFEGRVTFIQTPETPCLACIFKDSPPKGVFPVIGATPGITGTIQAMEALKYLAGTGSLLKGRLLCCDFLEMKFFELKVKKFPGCPACGGG